MISSYISGTSLSHGNMAVNKRIKRKSQLSLSFESSKESHSINKINVTFIGWQVVINAMCKSGEKGAEIRLRRMVL